MKAAPFWSEARFFRRVAPRTWTARAGGGRFGTSRRLVSRDQTLGASLSCSRPQLRPGFELGFWSTCEAAGATTPERWPVGS